MASSPWRVLMLAALVLTTGLAGCAGSEDGADDPTPGDGDDAEPTAEIPRWQPGDAWGFSIKTQGFPRTETTMLVYEETGDLYRIGTTDKRQALIHSLFNVNPQLGRIQKGNLAIFEDGEPRAMYRFPIQDGDAWPTEFFISHHGGQLTARATYSEAIETGIGTVEGFEVVATNNQGFEVRYDYIPEIQWFSKLVVTDSDGTKLHDIHLTSYERDQSGTGWFVRGSDLSDEGYTSQNCGFPIGCQRNVLVDGSSDKGGQYGGYDLVAFNVQINMTNPDDDRAEITITDGGDNEVYSRQFLQPQGDEFTFQTERDYEPGDWTITVRLTSGASAQVRLAGAWEFSGTI